MQSERIVTKTETCLGCEVYQRSKGLCLATGEASSPPEGTWRKCPTYLGWIAVVTIQDLKAEVA